MAAIIIIEADYVSMEEHANDIVFNICNTLIALKCTDLSNVDLLICSWIKETKDPSYTIQHIHVSLYRFHNKEIARHAEKIIERACKRIMKLQY